jgi:hypothetical protein
MGRRQFRRLRFVGVIGVLALLATFGVPAPSASAQARLEVVASNLDNPRGLAFGPNGVLYIAEAGRGGSGPCIAGPEGGQVCLGMSGAISRVVRGEQARIVTGLPSIAAADGSAAIGPVDVALRPNGNMFAIVGLGADPAARAALGSEGANLGQIYRFRGNGEADTFVDVAAYEATANPAGGALDSNPYSFVALADRFVVADAGANALIDVPTNGTPSTIAVFPSRVVPAPPIPNLPPELPMESVPDAVAIGPDGAYYVGELTGFPFQVGGARVYRVVPGQEPTIFAEGFTNIIDLAFGPDGELYVLEIFSKGFLQVEQPNGDPSGALTRIGRDGSRTVIASQGLIAPGGVAVGPDGAVYVSNFGILAGQGQVVRVTSGGPTLPETGEESAPLHFPDTGFSLDGEFLTYWQANGGLAVFGMPLDSARQVDGVVSQWLERTRFELHPKNAAPYTVLLGRLGVEALERQGRDWQSFPRAAPGAQHYFAETGHAITEAAFWQYWSSHGIELDGRRGISYAESLALFGFPVSEAQMETNADGDRVLTQWFERARFEYHPDNPAASRVLLGRLGAELR